MKSLKLTQTTVADNVTEIPALVTLANLPSLTQLYLDDSPQVFLLLQPYLHVLVGLEYISLQNVELKHVKDIEVG